MAIPDSLNLDMRFLLVVVLLIRTLSVSSQDAENYINAAEAQRIIGYLAADSLKGRGNFTREIEKAALFIDQEFRDAGLQQFGGLQSHLQPFILMQKAERFERVVADNKTVPVGKYGFISPFEYPPTLELKDFLVKEMPRAVPFEVLRDSLYAWQRIDTPILVLAARGEELCRRLDTALVPFPQHVRLLLPTNIIPDRLRVYFKPELRKLMLFNVLGVLPGKSRPGEIVMVTAHYDHVGVHRKDAGSDSIYNGANDNASGTAAMMMLARYFSARNDNERSLLFVAFAGEEIGLVGSTHLSSLLNADSIVAQVNLEMLGKRRERFSCIVTGQGALPSFFMKHAKKAGISIKPDPYTQERLFTRSDNYPFAQRKVPAHTFMIFNPNDGDYHQPSDEITTLDLENMAALVRGLVYGITELASGRFTPKRLR